MSRRDRAVIWFGRLVIGATTFIMVAIAIRQLGDLLGAARAMDIVLRSPSAVTIARVGLGGFPLGFAIALASCLTSSRRLLIGLWLVAAVVGGATVARVQGLVLDGATPYNLRLLGPEVTLMVLSFTAITLERRRSRRSLTS